MGEVKAIAIVDPRQGFCHFCRYQINNLLSYGVPGIALAISPLPHPLKFVSSDACALEGGRQTTPDLGH
jgi:hypothetical protein